MRLFQEAKIPETIPGKIAVAVNITLMLTVFCLSVFWLLQESPPPPQKIQAYSLLCD